jgi:hypothetical protein
MIQPANAESPQVTKILTLREEIGEVELYSLLGADGVLTWRVCGKTAQNEADGSVSYDEFEEDYDTAEGAFVALTESMPGMVPEYVHPDHRDEVFGWFLESLRSYTSDAAEAFLAEGNAQVWDKWQRQLQLPKPPRDQLVIYNLIDRSPVSELHVRSDELHDMSELIKRVTVAVFADSSAWSRYGIEWVLYDLERRVRVVLSEDVDRTELDLIGSRLVCLGLMK